MVGITMATEFNPQEIVTQMMGFRDSDKRREELFTVRYSLGFRLIRA
jgi:hypothetical protein